MKFTVLYVCSGNVCRSPSAAAMLARRLLACGRLSEIQVTSAGTEPATGQPWCVVDQKRVRLTEPELTDLAQRVPRHATPTRVKLADLILCADHETVGRLLRTAPWVRSRVFTIVEGASLAAAVTNDPRQETLIDVSDRAWAAPAIESSLIRLRWMVTEMDAARGQIPIAPQQRFGLFHRRQISDPTDILDVHSGTRRAHHQMLKQVGAAVDMLAGAIERTLVAPQSSHAPHS